MLSDEIDAAQRLVRTDAYQMSFGEIVNMYENQEIIIDPDFQRLFRWDIGQRTKLIESILLGIPLPPIFVFEKPDANWELVDGLQRVSTILEFMGRLRNPGGDLAPPSILEATKYLPSLHNAVWETSTAIPTVPVSDQRPIEKVHQLAIRRARVGVEILKRPSDDQTKFDLFQRLNSGGTLANAQELRNCIMLMVNKEFFDAVKLAAETSALCDVVGISEEQLEKQRHLEMAVRFLVHVKVPYNGVLDVEEFVDEGIVTLAQQGDCEGASSLIHRTFRLLNSAAGRDSLRRFENGAHRGKVGLVGLEGIAVGVGSNLEAILSLGEGEAVEFVRDKLRSFWTMPESASFTSPGLRGTTRIHRTVPAGMAWFKP